MQPGQVKEGGSCRDVAAALQGLRWEMPCKPDHQGPFCDAAVQKPDRHRHARRRPRAAVRRDAPLSRRRRVGGVRGRQSGAALVHRRPPQQRPLQHLPARHLGAGAGLLPERTGRERRRDPGIFDRLPEDHPGAGRRDGHALGRRPGRPPGLPTPTTRASRWSSRRSRRRPRRSTASSSRWTSSRWCRHPPPSREGRRYAMMTRWCRLDG